jgi:ABC-2 type transport system permease protein
MMRGGLRRMLAMARKEAIQLRRDPRSLALAFLLPVLMLFLFGYAITLDVKEIRLAVVDRSVSVESRRLVDAFVRSGYFTVTERPDGLAEAEKEVRRNRVTAILHIGPEFAADLAAGRPAPVQLLLDGSDANTASIALNYAGAIVAGQAASGGARPVLEVRSRVWYNESLESRTTIVPGLIAVIMSIIAAMLTSLTIAREWERGTMEQLAATPVSRVEVILGKLLPYLVIGLIDVAITCVAAVFLFAVPLRGSLVLLFFTSTLFLLGALGFGIFLSALLRSQLLASQASLMSTYLPALLLSGFIFAIANMPHALQVVSLIVPARYFVAITRGVFLKGVGLGVLWPDVAGLIVYSAIGIGLAIRVFRKEIA